MRDAAASVLIALAALASALGSLACTGSTATTETQAPGDGERTNHGTGSQRPPTGPAEEPDPVDTPDNCTGEPGSLYALSAKKLAGPDEVRLCRFKARVLLIVNGASHCGYTPNYTGLQKLYERYKSQGFEVLAFPSKSFNQEDSDEKTVSEFCTKEYKITFPMFAIGDVKKGPTQQPVYRWLNEQPGMEAEVGWNFEKFLVSKEGKAVKRFASAVDPDPDTNRTIEDAVKAELANP